MLLSAQIFPQKDFWHKAIVSVKVFSKVHVTLSPNAAGLLRLLLVLVNKKIVDIDKSKRCE